jgi:type IV pilus assembly protein PilE
MTNRNKITTASGFTLIELLIAVAIVAILTAIAYPGYQDSVMKARRGDAQADLVQYAAFAERVFTEDNDYRRATTALAGLANTNFYNYSVAMLPVAPARATSFTITATAQAGQTNDTCGTTLSLTNAGVTVPNTTGCWN